MKTTLLIMAAGIGSRFGTGIKQLEPVDASNHIIMDYSIHDAIEAGFNHVVFIIRKDIEKEFKEVIGDRIASICSSHNVTIDYAFQDINDIPGTLPEGRTKPWGTGQAVLAAKNVIDTPFIVINADDYYGKEGFKAVHEYLVNGGKSCMAGFVLKNTLSDNGGVTRGICKMDENGNLTEVVETKNIVKTADGAEVDGVTVDVNSLVSMNMWGLVLVNMRAHDNSEGAFSTLGAVEKYDCKEWTNWAVNRFGKQTSIFLMGISMGASSVMLSSSLDLPDSVHGIIDDCGYSSALEMINVNCKNRLPSYIPVGVFDFFINIGTKMWGKFSLSETDACDALSKTNIPVLIIHGNADTQAPLYMAYRLYNSCRSEKSLLIVNDAGHAESYSKDPDTYEKTVKEFIQKHL